MNRDRLEGKGVAECDGSVGADFCIGYVLSCPDSSDCCPPEGWYTWVWREVLGQQSARGHAEERTLTAGRLLLHSLGGFATGLEEHAYDHGATVSPSLVDEVRAAFYMFELCFPDTRWNWNPRKMSGKDYGNNGQCHDVRWGGWNENRLMWPDWRVDAIEAASGVAITSAMRRTLRAHGLADEHRGVVLPLAPLVPGGGPSPALQPVPALASWLDAAAASLATVPVRGTDYVDAQPTIETLVSVVDGQLVPSPWLAQFVGVFRRREVRELGLGAKRPDRTLKPKPGGWASTGESSHRKRPRRRAAAAAAAGTAIVVALAWGLL